MNTLEDLPLGQQLRDTALAKHHDTHKADIQRVRLALLAACRMQNIREITGDDASVIADQLGIPGDRRWLGACFRGWSRVKNTGRVQPSRLARRNARPVAIWELLPKEDV